MKNPKRNHYRLILQLGVIGVLFYLGYLVLSNGPLAADFEAYCPFGGLQALANFGTNQSLACSMTSLQIAMGIALVLAIVFFGKLFCSYICPLGTITEWLGSIGRRLKVHTTLTGIADKSLRLVKYGLLIVVFYFTLQSSELFCKTFDPFFAAATGFGPDVETWMAIASIAVLVLGSIFFRMFWCKYACPLGALSNIFMFPVPAFTIVLVFLGMIILGVQVSFFYALIPLAILGYAGEISGKVFGQLPRLKITRDHETCIDCKKCDQACPQGIDVSQYKQVNHIDCHNCGECLGVCPVDQTLGFNKTYRTRWLPAALVVALFLTGLFAGNQFEIPTVRTFWGNPQLKGNAETLNMEDLRDIKCYGSSMAFVNHMKQVAGVVGVSTFVKNHEVKVQYDPSRTTKKKIKKAIFSPARMMVTEPSPTTDSLLVIRGEINNFFDAYDNRFMTRLLKQIPGVYGFETFYGEPVQMKIYRDPHVEVDLYQLRQVMEQDQLQYKQAGVKYTEELNFDVVELHHIKEKKAVADFMKTMYRSYDGKANQRDTYQENDIAVFRVRVTGYPKNVQRGPHLRNDIARRDTGIVRVKTYYAGDHPVAEIEYVKALTDSIEVWQQMSKDTLKLTYDNGFVQKIRNPYTFQRFGQTKSQVKPQNELQND